MGHRKVRCADASFSVPDSTLLVTVATLSERFSFTWCSEGSFWQDTGAILAITDAPQDISFGRYDQRPEALALQILKIRR